ncbi:MAG: hypothetical protein HYV03_05870 [Deltaproteobacteria bacterium]|nr:hypothetical protein [Deltaproteobacteria bacterium]
MKRKDIVTRLLTGHGAMHRKYRGRHVMVAGEKVVPLRRGRSGVKDFQGLTKQFGKPPLLLFVPRDDVTYILWLCH